MKQDRAALEDRDVSIGQPRHLAEGLVREMPRIPRAKGRAVDAIGQAGLFQRPTHAYVAHVAPRRFGNPVEGGENQVAHSHLPQSRSTYRQSSGTEERATVSMPPAVMSHEVYWHGTLADSMVL